MRALEFNSIIRDNQILIPKENQSQFVSNASKLVRVIVLIDELEEDEDLLFSQSTKSQFLKGYADSDSIYDAH